jgi:DNA primase
MIPKETIEKIFDAADIVEVINDFVNLKKAGSNYKGNSPFSDDKTPSFMVSPAKGIFKDFSSGEGGTVVSFLMKHEHFTYPEALRWLAKRYNIEIEEEERTPEQVAAQSARESLYLVNQFAKDYFSKQILESQEGKAIGLSYFKERGYNDATIKKFELGYSPDNGSAFTKAALSAGYKLEYLEKTGLSKTNEKGSFDFFRGRVIFPIHNLTGRILGFGGRTLKTDKKIAKYFNSPESEIYHKSNVLYGLYQAKGAIIKQDTCYLVEGYTDVVSLNQAGIENVVASSGTALTEGQIKLIKRYTNNISILYDGDSAGIKASFRGIDLILEQGMNVKVILFPDGEDPDSYSKKVGITELEEYLREESKDFIRFKASVLLSDAKDDPLKRAETIKDIVKSIAIIPDQIIRSVYIRETSQLFDISEKALLSEVNKILAKKRSSHPQQQRQQIEVVQPTVSLQKRESSDGSHGLGDQEKDLIRLMLTYGAIGIEVEIEAQESEELKKEEIPLAQYIIEELLSDELKYINDTYQSIFDEFLEGIENGLIVNDQHFFQKEEATLSTMVVDLTMPKDSVSENWGKKHRIFPQEEKHKLKQAAVESVYMYKLRVTENMINGKQLGLKTEKEEKEIYSLLEQIKQLNQIRNTFASKLGIIITR